MVVGNSNQVCGLHLAVAVQSLKPKSQWKAGQSSFGAVKFDARDASELEYNGSDSGKVLSDGDSTLLSISAMQNLYSVFLPSHLHLTTVEYSGSMISMVQVASWKKLNI